MESDVIAIYGGNVPDDLGNWHDPPLGPFDEIEYAMAYRDHVERKKTAIYDVIPDGAEEDDTGYESTGKSDEQKLLDQLETQIKFEEYRLKVRKKWKARRMGVWYKADYVDENWRTLKDPEEIKEALDIPEPKEGGWIVVSQHTHHAVRDLVQVSLIDFLNFVDFPVAHFLTATSQTERWKGLKSNGRLGT